MKIAAYLLSILLIAALGAAAIFYIETFEPMYADYKRMKTGMPELDRAKVELRKYQEQEAWVKPAVGALKAGLADEVNAGEAEVAAAGPAIVVNISEDIMYTPGSVTFSVDSPRFRLKLAALLAAKELKGRQIIVGHSTDSVPARGRGRKRVPPREGRTLAADRAVAMAKYLEQNKVAPEMIVAAGYAAKLPDTGFKIKDHKTIIVIQNPPAPSREPAKAKPVARTLPPNAIPIKRAQPKRQ